MCWDMGREEKGLWVDDETWICDGCVNEILGRERDAPVTPQDRDTAKKILNGGGTWSYGS